MLDNRPDTALPEVHSQDSRYDGSRTAPEVQYEIMRRHREGMTLAAIAREVHCDERTAKAVISNWGNSAHRLRLEAHKSELIDHVLTSWKEAADRGKSDSLKSWTDSFGITEPNRAAGAPQIAVQVNLHGGPEPVSLAKVSSQSESLTNQAVIEVSPIISVMDTAQVTDAQGVSGVSIPQTAITATLDTTPMIDAKPLADTSIQANKCEVVTGQTPRRRRAGGPAK